MPSLESFERTINAFASVMIPRDDGSITVLASAPVGTLTLNGIVLTAQPGVRVTNPTAGGLKTFDSTAAATATLSGNAAIANSIRDAINDPANPFLAAGIVASRTPAFNTGSPPVDNQAGSATVNLRRTAPASVIVDTCTNVTVAQAVIGDFAAGSLSRQVTPLHVETFAMQVIRWVRAQAAARVYWNYSSAVPEGLIDPGFGLDVTEDDALIVFDELDAQAQFFGYATFADMPIGQLFPMVAGTQTDVCISLIASSPNSFIVRGDSGLSAAQIRTLATVPLVMAALKAAYYLNYPNHKVWGKNNLGVGNSGTGTGEPVFSGNPADEVSNPNNRAVLTAFTYRRWPGPIRQGLEDRWRTAMLEVVVNPGLANTEFIDLTTEWNRKTMINIG